MTYCVGMKMNRGLVFMSDTRTNAGIDNVSTFRKMFTWEKPGERVITLLSAGNLATTQAVVSLIDERTKAPEDRRPSLLDTPSMFQTARVVGDTLKEVINSGAVEGQRADSAFNATFILGGQIKGGDPRLFMIYPEGNFVESGDETPFFQIGEHKYGKPILDRVARNDMRLGEAAKMVLLSFDSTLRSNLSVGMPIDLLLYECGSLTISRTKRIEKDDAYFSMLSSAWSGALREAFANIEPFDI